MTFWRQNLISAFRRFRQFPSLALAVVVSIGLGIAANATIFSMVSTFVLRPAPVGDPTTLMTLHNVQKGERCCNEFPWPLYQDVRSQAKAFSGVAAYYELLPASISGGSEPERVWGQAATSNFFDVAQLRMTLGRGFAPEEENRQVIVLGYSLWKIRFAADRSILGKTVTLSGHPFTVIGVTPPAFRGVDLILNSAFWVPLGNIEQLGTHIPDRSQRNFHWLAVIGRLRPGVTRTQAAAELSTLARDLGQAYPETDKDMIFPFEQAGTLPPREKPMFLLFIGALSVVVLLVLCIAGANVANLLLAQAASRQREMAVRLALGAKRRQLMNQILTESVLLALGGGLFGVGLSLWATWAISAFHLPAPVPIDIRIGVDWRVLLYTFALSIGAGLLFGLAPAWAAARPILAAALKGEDALVRPGRRITLRSVLVVGQIAMSLVLLCATSLFLRSLENAAAMNIGFRQNNLLMLSVDPRVHGYTPEHTVQFLSQLSERAAAIPGVLSAVTTDITPLSMGGRSDGFQPEGAKSTDPNPGVDLYMVTPGYFEALGIPRLAGRDIGSESASAPKVGVVNQEFVHEVFHDQNPVGRLANGSGTPYRIIGVVGNTRSRTIGEDQRPVLYRSLAQSVTSDPSFLGYTLILRTTGDEAAIAVAARNAVHTLDPTMAIYNEETMRDHLRDALFLPRLAGALFGVFGITGLVLAAVGLYGVMSYSVSRRTREIGIRIALGAQSGTVQRLVIHQGMMLALIALSIGMPAVWLAAKFCASFLYGVHPHDLTTFTLVPVFLATAALCACWLPARRAATVNPQTALRRE